jgi:outer membrane murein-binding lipoprotein Lpp
MSKELKIVIVAALIFLSFFAYGSVKKEYARITTRVETTQAKVDSLADELQATTATIHAAIRSITDRFLERQETSDIVKGDILKAELQKLNDVNSLSKRTSSVPTIIMHSGYNCGPCNAWIANRMPLYIQSGWRVEVVKETDTNRAWPWYQITDADGVQFQVDGPLDNAKFQAAKRGQ